MNVLVITFDKSDDKDKVKKYMTEQKASYPVVIADAQEEDLGKIYAIKFIPFSVLINPEGKIVFKALRGDAMFDTIKKAMGIKT